MKKNLIVGIAIALGTFSMGPVSAPASDSVTRADICEDKQAFQQFVQETAPVYATLKAKEIELNELYAYHDFEGMHEGIDVAKIIRLEAEIGSLKDKLAVSAKKYGIVLN